MEALVVVVVGRGGDDNSLRFYTFRSGNFGKSLSLDFEGEGHDNSLRTYNFRIVEKTDRLAAVDHFAGKHFGLLLEMIAVVVGDGSFAVLVVLVQGCAHTDSCFQTCKNPRGKTDDKGACIYIDLQIYRNSQ